MPWAIPTWMYQDSWYVRVGSERFRGVTREWFSGYALGFGLGWESGDTSGLSWRVYVGFEAGDWGATWALSWHRKVTILIVSASRNPPGQAPKRLDFWRSFSQSGGLFGVIFNSFFDHWKHSGSAGGPLCGIGVGVVLLHIFGLVRLCFSASFVVELQGLFFMDLACILNSFSTVCYTFPRFWF